MATHQSDLMVWSDFKTTFEPLLSTSAEAKIASVLEANPALEKNDSDLEDFQTYWDDAHDLMKGLFETSTDVVFRIANWKILLQKAKDNFERSIFHMSNSSPENAALFMNSLVSHVRKLVEKFKTHQSLPVTKDYTFSISSDYKDQATEALQNFVRIGKSIRADKAAYNNSYAKKLEDMLLSTENIVKPLVYVQFNKHFFALTAPSMEGKTQSAFVFERVKPLYFSLAVLEIDERAGRQPIYENFRSLTETLIECALFDLKSLGILKSFPSATFLNEAHENTQFLTLGFLAALARTASEQPPEMSWMEFYSVIPRLNFKSTTIAEIIQSGIFKQFVVMLDEFDASATASLILNLARAAHLTCVVANTKTEVANVVGRTSSSGSQGINVWSLVITHLDPAFVSVLDSEFNFSETINSLVEKRGNKGDDPVCLFLRDLHRTQIKKMRAGVAAFVAEILLLIDQEQEGEFKGFSQWDLGQLLFILASKLSSKLIYRKATLYSSILAMRGQLALLVPETYAPQCVLPNAPERARLNNYEANVFRHVRFLEKHLFYLINPSDRQSWFFLTFPPDMIALPGDRPTPFTIIKNQRLHSWQNEYTEFNQSDFLTILACFLIPTRFSCAMILDDAINDILSDSASLAQSPNLIAFKLDGNSLEVSAALCIAKASHDIDAQTCFSGITAERFIKNIIYEMNRHRNFLSSSVEMKFPDELQNLLSGMKVPFIYSISFENAIFDQCSSFGYRLDNGFLAQTDIRTADRSKIDGIFGMQRIHDDAIFNVVVECKHRQNKLGSKELTPILTRIWENHLAALCSVFCGQCTAYTEPDSALATYCEDHAIDLYRFVNTSDYSGKHLSVDLELYCKGSTTEKPTRLTCIVFENKVINPVLVQEVDDEYLLIKKKAKV